MKKRPEENSSGIKFKLAELLKEKGYSKNKLCVRCNLRFETVQGYCLGNISRVDLYVLAAICRELDCKIEDIIEFDKDSADNAAGI
ncbi:MAG: helix-turn-helix transcriptional regulator [Ruminococcus sp.]|nr:helix-turn-helix transcriptional regulator [Ruminococcus sp.]